MLGGPNQEAPYLESCKYLPQALRYKPAQLQLERAHYARAALLIRDTYHMSTWGILECRPRYMSAKNFF